MKINDLSITLALLKKGRILMHTDDDENLIHIWYSKKTGCFCYEFNCKVLHAKKTWKSFSKLINGKAFELI